MSKITGFLNNAFDTGVQMEIVFDSPSSAYYVGQKVTGYLKMNVKETKKFRNIIVTCKGEAHVRWSTSSRDTEVFEGKEKYYEASILVIGGLDGEITLEPGEFSYPFIFQLPLGVPSSFEGKHGSIRYTIRAVMNRPWKLDHDCKTAFTVVSPLDLNTIPSIKDPVTEQKSKTMCCLWCKSGPLELSVQLPCSGFVPGQTIPFKIDIDNPSTVLVRSIKCIIRKNMTWTATSPYKQKKEKVVVNKLVVEGVAPNSSKTFSENIKIPAVPPSNLHHCNIIDLEYVFKVDADPGLPHRNLTVIIPITLGTFPLLTGPTKFVSPSPPPPNTSEKRYFPGPEASATPPGYADLPPPTFEESVLGGKSIKDANDGKHTQGLTNFVPRYPVWNFEHN